MIDQAVLHCLLRGHIIIAFRIDLDTLQRLSGICGQDLIQLFLRLQNMIGNNLDLRRLSLRTAGADGS